MKNVAVVIPFYKPKLNNVERISLEQCYHILGAHDIVFIVPQSIDSKCIPIRKNASYTRFSDDNFLRVEKYNKMLLDVSFYERFLEYEYILIYQLDAFVFKDDLLSFCNMGYDYYGAPWVPPIIQWFDEHPRFQPKRLEVGNGGFSLRKVSSCIKYLRETSFDSTYIPEDVFFSYNFTGKLSIAPLEVSFKFALEQNAKYVISRTKSLPFGCHQWNIHDGEFFRPIIESYGHKTDYVIDRLDRLREPDKVVDEWLLADKDTIRKVVFEILCMEDVFEYEIFVWGYGQIGRKIEWLFFRNDLRVTGFLDKNLFNEETMLYKYKIMNPNGLKYKQDMIVFIAMKNDSDVIKILEDQGIRKIVRFKDFRMKCEEKVRANE